MIQLGNGQTLLEYGKLNIILGKNGSGKSRLLRQMDQDLSPTENCIRYVTPERGGKLRYEGNIDTNRANDPNWLGNARRTNRFDQFRQSSVSEFKSLETMVLRRIEKDEAIRASGLTFDTDLEKINSVLDNVKLTRQESSSFKILRKADETDAHPAQISSGESELINLAIEILSFSYLCRTEKFAGKDNNWLLLDEPDVHLHPDLQNRLMTLLAEALDGVNARALIATHSTSILGSLVSLDADTRLTLLPSADTNVAFRPASAGMEAILPIFGAHPLSNIFNQRPPLIVEGEDDERIWQACVRRSTGRVSVFPCVAGDIQSLNEYEVAACELIGSVYENARAYSLRDRDDDPYDINDMGPVVRAKTQCRSAENLMLSDDALAELGTDWPTLKATLEQWIDTSQEHQCRSDMGAFQNSGWDRANFNLKPLRMLIAGLSGSSKPWEVAVGQAIARLNEHRFHGATSMQTFLGPKIVEELQLLG